MLFIRVPGARITSDKYRGYRGLQVGCQVRNAKYSGHIVVIYIYI